MCTHRGERRRDVLDLLVRNNRLPSFAGDLAAMISAAQRGASFLEELIARSGADTVRAAVNFNIDETERRFREEVARWPDGSYAADVWIDHDTVGNKDVRVHVNCIVEGDQLTVDMTGSDDRPELMNVWNTFSNSRGYAMAQLASMVDPAIVKNEGLFNAVEMVIPYGTILQPPPNKPAALGAFHPACEIGEAICIALSEILPHQIVTPGLQARHAQHRDRLWMPRTGQMWMDQGVDTRASDASATRRVSTVGVRCAAVSAT